MGSRHHSFLLHHRVPFPIPPQGPFSQEDTHWRGRPPSFSGGPIEPVPPQHRGKGFYLKYFLIPKKRGWSSILDLQQLNAFIYRLRFRMVTLMSIILSLNRKDWFTTLDVEDAYFHIDIHPSCKRFLRFALGSNHYRYRVLPFGLATAPWVFTMLLSFVVAHFHHHRSSVFPCLEDWLLMEKSN